MKDRKKDHINQAFHARVNAREADVRFNYEPLLAGHASDHPNPFPFAGKTMHLPLWVSSMTGGTALAGTINRNLARAVREFGLGMGLGSCRILLDDDHHFADFDMRPIIGDEAPFYANLGIAQLEHLIDNKATDKIEDIVRRLRADGLIIHINPLQEAFQPEGDRFTRPPLETLQAFLEQTKLKVIVKEVGQGMGPESLRHLFQLPLQAIEFGALGGTNFTLLELSRHQNFDTSVFEPYARIGHTAEDMTRTANKIIAENENLNCQQLIISGGISNVLDGYYLTQISRVPSVFGMGSALLKVASDEYATLQHYLQQVVKSYQLARSYLTIREKE